MADDASRERFVARRIKQLIEPIGAAAFASPASFDAGQAVGITDPFACYVAFRSAPLGGASPATVAALFGPFEPDVVRRALRPSVAIEQLLDARDEGAGATLNSVLGPPDIAAMEVAHTVLERAVASLPSAGRAMFAARRDLEPATDPWTALWRVSDEIREHRGDAHTIAWSMSGLDAVEVNLITAAWVGMPFELRTSLMGFDQAANDAGLGRLRSRGLLDGDELTDAGRSIRERIETTIDAQQRSMAEVVSDDDMSTLERVLAPWGTALVDAGAYPAPPESVFPL